MCICCLIFTDDFLLHEISHETSDFFIGLQKNEGSAVTDSWIPGHTRNPETYVLKDQVSRVSMSLKMSLQYLSWWIYYYLIVHLRSCLCWNFEEPNSCFNFTYIYSSYACGHLGPIQLRSSFMELPLPPCNLQV